MSSAFMPFSTFKRGLLQEESDLRCPTKLLSLVQKAHLDPTCEAMARVKTELLKEPSSSSRSKQAGVVGKVKRVRACLCVRGLAQMSGTKTPGKVRKRPLLRHFMGFKCGRHWG